jgi:ATP-dependent DNA helicase PIF1
MGKRWTIAEEEHLLSLLQNSKTLDDCGVTLNRSVCALTARLEKIALDLYKTDKSLAHIQMITKLPIEHIEKITYLYNLPNHNAEWDDKQDNWLRKYIGKYGSNDCANKMGRTESEIDARILSLAIDDYPAKISTTIENFEEKIALMKNYIPFDELDKIGEPPYYVVLTGRHKGVYNTVEGSRMSTVGYKNAKYKKCNSTDELHKYIGTQIKKPSNFPNVVLSDEQENVIKEVLEGKNILLMGSGGTGKSTLIKHIMQMCNERTIPIGITASTGSAAVLIDGKTVHSFLGIGLAKESARSLASSLLFKYKKKAKELKELEILLIDEVSMIDGGLLTKISEYLSIIRNDTRHFGGLQLILSGDMYQLPPVQGTLVFNAAIWDELELCPHILTKIYRQENDIQFQEILERAKLGAVTNEDIDILKQCKGQYFTADIKPTCLYPTNAKVDIVNTQEYHLLKEPEMEYPTLYSNKESKTYCDNIGIVSVLKLKIGTQVMVTRNVNAELKLANGTRGVVVHMLPDCVVIQTLYGNREIRRFDCINDNDKTLAYSLMPLKLAWAVTIHKAQGVTLDCCKIDIGESLFAYGQAYTALSRVKDLKGLCVINIVKSAFKTHPEVLAFYKKLC